MIQTLRVYTLTGLILKMQISKKTNTFLCVLLSLVHKSTVSLIRFFCVPTTYVLIEKKENECLVMNSYLN